MHHLCYPVSTEEAHLPFMGLSGPFEKNLDLLQAHGFAGVELMVRQPRELCADRIAQQLKDRGLKAAALGVAPMVAEDHLALASPDKAVRREALERAKSAIELAGVLQAPFCIGRFRGFIDPQTPGNSREDALRTFEELGHCAAQCGTTILIEPQSTKNGNYLNSVPEAVEWICLLGQKNFELILDVYHLDLTSPSLLGALAQAQGRCGLVHLCDSDRRMMGFGRLDLESFLRRLLADGYTGFFSTEINQLPDMQTAVRMTADYYRYMQRVVLGLSDDPEQGGKRP